MFFFFLFFGRMRLKKHSEKTDDARPKREQDQRKRGRASSGTRKSSALSHLSSKSNNECGIVRKTKISRCLLARHWQKRTSTPFTGRRLSSSGSLSGVSSSSSTLPLRLRHRLSRKCYENCNERSYEMPKMMKNLKKSRNILTTVRFEFDLS